MMRKANHIAFLLALFALPSIASSLGNGGGAFGGLSLTPTAQIDPGAMTMQYQNRVIGTGRFDGINLTGVFGLNTFLEVGGRIAANTTTVNLYTGDGGARDLSASVKLQFNPLIGLEKSPLKLSAGASDIGGAATLFRSHYGVASYQGDAWNASLGYSQAGENNKSFNPLNGAFANGSVKLKPWLQLGLETTAQQTWASVGFQNESFLNSLGAPQGTSFYLRANTQIRGSNIVGGKPWVDVGFRMPLDWTQIKSSEKPLFKLASSPLAQPVSPMNSISADAPSPSNSIVKLVEPVLNQEPSSKESLLAYAQELTDRLIANGFEGVSLGYVGDMLIVKASDMVYEHSLMDGAGVALGQIAKTAPAEINQYRYVHARWGTPAVGFTGDIRCLKDWLDRGFKCGLVDVAIPEFRNLQKWTQNVNWWVENAKDFRFTPRVKLNPVQNYYVATEFSLLDYSVGLNVQPSMLLWEGGSIEASKIYSLKSTQGYDRGEIFNYTRIRDGMNGIMLTHIQKLNDGFSGRLNFGQIGTGFYKGGHAELRWDSLDGQYAAGFNQGYWKANNNWIQKIGKPSTAYARYSPSQKDWALEVIAGKYWYGDKGLSVISSHWMGDVKLSLYLRRSVPPERFWPGQYGATFAGLEVSFPLTPRKAMNADNFQVKGSSRMGLSLSTPVGRKDNYIVDPFGVPIYIKALVDSPVAGYLGSVLMDYDRNRPSYVYGHLERLRYAYEKWVKEN
jgi:hypothetical protein